MNSPTSSRSELRCLDHSDGLALATREGEPFLTLNGIQTQSAQVYDLSGALDDLQGLGVAVVRLSPQSTGMIEIIHAFRAALDGRTPPVGASRALAPHAPLRCNGYWHGIAGLEYRETA